MWIAIAILALILVAALVYLATLDGGFQVRRSLEIDAAPATVFAAIVDFKSWPEWSPWLLHEPDTRIEYNHNYDQEGGFYRWDGQVVGAGKLTHVNIKPTSHIDQRIEFTRPFKSSSEVGWDFQDLGDKTRLSWEMKGRMPFLFRFMAKRMEPMIARDYDLGLALLNGYLNADAPHPTLQFIGKQQLEDFSYWSIPCNGNLRQLEKSRPSAIETLTTAAQGKTGLALTIYRQFDPLAADFQAEISIPVTENMPASNYTRREFTGGQYFQLNLLGDHRFLPLAWYALSCHCRMHKIKVDRSRASLEIYHVDPAVADNSNDVKTALYLPIR